MIGAALREPVRAPEAFTKEDAHARVLIDDCALNFPHLQASALTPGVQLT
jgi:hypothetical protein